MKILSLNGSKWHTKWHKCPKIKVELICLEIGTKRISDMLIANMNVNFDNIVTELVQMAHNVAQISKHRSCIDLSQNSHRAYVKEADFEYGHEF